MWLFMRSAGKESYPVRWVVNRVDISAGAFYHAMMHVKDKLVCNPREHLRG